jgi:hypothetical protein
MLNGLSDRQFEWMKNFHDRYKNVLIISVLAPAALEPVALGG